jgi:UDP-GlcNAc3NAcA epimerase
MTTVATVVGARPQFVKAAVVSKALNQVGFEEYLLHTGQHYDASMSDVFFGQLSIPSPKYNLAVGSGRHGAQTARMLEGIEQVLLNDRPDWVLVYGDTNSTAAAALAAAKLHIPLAHVEAGLRSFNRRMPEEINRVIVDHLSDLLLAPTAQAVSNLEREGLSGSKVHLVGDVMLDVARVVGGSVDFDVAMLDRLGVTERNFVLATLHRAENTDDPKTLATVVQAFEVIGRTMPVLFPAHPRTIAACERHGVQLLGRSGLHVLDPLGYREMLVLERNAAVVVTDSGGVQKEAFFQRTPCVTVRPETEWTELVDLGWNRLVSPESVEVITSAVGGAVGSEGRDGEPYGDGHAADRVAACLRAIG